MRLTDHTAAIRSILQSIAELEESERVEALAQLMVSSGLRGLEGQLTQGCKTLPERVETKLATASSDQLEEWGFRLLNADSLPDVFGPIA